MGLIFTAYNLRRIFNLISPNELQKHLKGFALYFWCLWELFLAFLSHFIFPQKESNFYKILNYKRLQLI